MSDTCKLKLVFAEYEISLRNREKTSDIAMRRNPILAINVAAYGFNDRSYVIRDGVVYRNTSLNCSPLVIQKDGDLRIYNEDLTGAKLVAKGAMHIYDFGPDLIRDGELVNYTYEAFRNNKNPTIGIGQIGSLEYTILIVDGRSELSEGMTLYYLAVELKNRGCYWGYNLDGGGSTTLYFNGEVLNNPSDGSERRISDILYFID